ncbi:hypothetical protein ASPZODRAFT_133092 [Penicilliopsis zonata CBS 506.65]|uniref:Uncharacterized protein n=1 Tax=Penicilliopsis zonata CBS 506.65 TaxID=1073090 RepID=A0A1L9SG03_9EURO|nr:hypothetical protein ASPZODRAFT_133092 [Penicilliopsis zonata CBS 506.65]OJJ46102.1 hypothetical protein ASPZODRAFT_133092 [Penicilliopsis zonata CBS 506.65]
MSQNLPWFSKDFCWLRNGISGCCTQGMRDYPVEEEGKFSLPTYLQRCSHRPAGPYRPP